MLGCHEKARNMSDDGLFGVTRVARYSGAPRRLHVFLYPPPPYDFSFGVFT